MTTEECVSHYDYVKYHYCLYTFEAKAVNEDVLCDIRNLKLICEAYEDGEGWDQFERTEKKFIENYNIAYFENNELEKAILSGEVC